MDRSNANTFRIAATFMIVAAALQVFGLIRHLERLPSDWVGISIYLVCIIAFVMAAFGFYSRGREG